MERMDDFVMMAPLDLHMSCGIPVKAVELLYTGAEKMIRMTCHAMAHEIKDIWELREAYGQILDRMNGEAGI
jgi:hypothetical protein